MTKFGGFLEVPSKYLSDFCEKQSNLIGNEVTYTQFEELRDIARFFIENPEL